MNGGDGYKGTIEKELSFPISEFEVVILEESSKE